MIIGLLGSLRPKQWTENLLVFAGYLFTIQQVHPAGTLLKAVAAFALFCAVSGATYIYNDAADAECDRKHPLKCKRPIASGRVPLSGRRSVATALLAAAVYACFGLELNFGIPDALASCVDRRILSGPETRGYSGLAYNCGAVRYQSCRRSCRDSREDIAVAPDMQHAVGAVSGWQSEEVSFWHWKTALTVTARPSVKYSVRPVDEMLSIASSTSLMAYFLYTISANPRTGILHPQMMLTAPFVVYGLFRYLYLIHSKNAGDSPERLLLEDKPLLIDVILYIAAAIIALELH